MEGTRGRATWSSEMKKMFIDLCLEQVKLGGRPGANLKTSAWKKVMEEFNKRNSVNYEQKQFKNYWDMLRKQWNTWKRLISLTGIGEVAPGQTVQMDQERWDEYITAYPDAKQFRYKPLPHADEMEQLFGGVTATGDNRFNSTEHDHLLDRAAEVHNLSEKRRRSRINEKMKALQNLIPNSNKTDKASMLDEAIDYLKQLQLQVQMLSMRNGLNLHPLYMAGGLQPLQLSSQMHMGFGVNGGSSINMHSVSMPPMNQQNSSSRKPLDLPNHCTPSHQSIVIPSTTDMTNPDTTFGIESSQTHDEPFHLSTAAEEIYKEDVLTQHQRTTSSSPERPSGLEAEHLVEAQDVVRKDRDHNALIQQLHCLQTCNSQDGGVKRERLHI